MAETEPLTETVPLFDDRDVNYNLPTPDIDPGRDPIDPAGASDRATDPAPDESRYVSKGYPVQIKGGKYLNGNSGAELLDAFGRPFDSRRHESEPTATGPAPALTRKGTIRRKRGGPGHSAPLEPEPRPERPAPANPRAFIPRLDARDVRDGPAPEPPHHAAAGASPHITTVGSETNDLAAKAFAAVLVETMSGTAAGIAGTWAAQTPDEKSAQVTAWAAYLQTLDMSAPPPWSIPLLATAPWCMRVASDSRSPWNKPKPKPKPVKQETETPGPAAKVGNEPGRYSMTAAGNPVDRTELD